VTPPQAEPQEGPSGSIPEEGTVIIEMTAPRKLLPLKTLQREKMWRWKTVILMILTLCRPGLMFAGVCVCVLVFYKSLKSKKKK